MRYFVPWVLWALRTLRTLKDTKNTKIALAPGLHPLRKRRGATTSTRSRSRPQGHQTDTLSQQRHRSAHYHDGTDSAHQKWRCRCTNHPRKRCQRFRRRRLAHNKDSACLILKCISNLPANLPELSRLLSTLLLNLC